jgi:hypothetical protein
MAKFKLDAKEAIDYGQGRERMNPDLENKLRTRTTSLSKNPAFPDVDKNGIPDNFEELVASKRFKDVVEKVKRYTGMQDISGQNAFMQLQRVLMGAVQRVAQIESQNKEYLENLAVDLVIKEMGIPDGSFQFDAKLVSMGSIDQSRFKKQAEEPEEEEVEQQFGGQQAEEDLDDFMSAMEKFDLEKAKRRFINALIQGSSKKGHYMFELVRNELNRIDPQLLNLYGVLMSINDLVYWLMPDAAVQMMASNPSSMAGKEEVDDTTDPPTIRARGLFFPVLIHELIKGVMEVFGTHGLPDDPKSQQMIMGSTDTLPNEIWDLRLGPVIWEKFSRAYPAEIFEDDKKHIQHYLFARFSALDTKQFFEIAKQILSGDPKGEKFLQDMVRDIITDLKKRDLDDALGSYDDDDDYDDGYDDDGDDDGDLDDFLGGLGISRPK